MGQANPVTDLEFLEPFWSQPSALGWLQVDAFGVEGLQQIRGFGKKGGKEGKSQRDSEWSLSGTLLAPGVSVHRKEIRSDGETEARKGACPSQDHTSNPTQFKYTRIDQINRPKSSVLASELLWATCLSHELVRVPICKMASSSAAEGGGWEK